MVKQREVHSFFIGLSVISIPFIGSISGIASLGWLGRELSFYPLVIGMVIWLMNIVIKGESIKIPQNKSFVYLLYFLVIILLSGCINCSEIFYVSFNGQSGLYIFGMQFASMLCYTAISVYVYNWLRMGDLQTNLKLFYKWLLISFFIAGLYSVFELGKILGNETLTNIVVSIDEMFRPQVIDTDTFINYGRIRSVASEASYFGMYSGIIFPWIISLPFLVEYRHKFFIPMVYTYFIILNLLSISRTAYFIFAIQLVLYFILFRKEIKEISAYIINSSVLLLVCLLILNSFFDSKFNFDIVEVFRSILGGDGGMFSSSNDARFGSQYAALSVFFNNPIIGVGFGLAGIYIVDFYPSWSLYNVEIKLWTEGVVTQSGLPSTHGLYSRLMAETGMIGLFVWLLYIFSMAASLLKRINDEYSPRKKIILKGFFISLVGVFMFAFNIDAFRLMAYWIIFSYIWYLIDCNDTIDDN